MLGLWLAFALLEVPLSNDNAKLNDSKLSLPTARVVLKHGYL